MPCFLTSIATPVVFSLGVVWDSPIAVVTEGVILAFPSGRLGGPVERAIRTVAVLAGGITCIAPVMTAPQFAPALLLTGCRPACPGKNPVIWSPLSWAPRHHRQLMQLPELLEAAEAVALRTRQSDDGHPTALRIPSP